MTDRWLRDIDEALIRLRHLWVVPQRLRDERLGSIDMSTVWVVHSLAQHGDALTVSRLAEVMDVAQSTASRLIARAEASGTVSRRPDPGDNRAVLVHLTEEGGQLADAAQCFRMDLLERAMQDFTGDEMQVFAELLTRFAMAPKEGPT